VILWCYLL